MIASSALPHRQPVRVAPPPQRLPTWRLIGTLVRNPIEVWPEAVYRERVYRDRLLSQDALYVMDPDAIREVLVDQAAGFAKTKAMRRALGPALGEGLLTADGARWRWQRRAAAPTFRHERVLAFLPAMIAAAERTRESLAGAVGRPIDVAQAMMHTTYDIIVETMLSGRAGIDVDRVEQAITDYLDSTSWTVMLALMGAPAWTPYPGRRRAERARNYLRAEVLRVVAERRASPERRTDLIGLLLDTADPETGQAMNDGDVTDNLLTFIAAGHETTALALAWTFYLLDLHPEIEHRVLDEIAAVTDGGPLRPEHVPDLGYARQVVQEAMRLYPPAPLVVREAMSDLTIAGEAIAAGTSVLIPVYAVHRHERLWDAPDRFDPERFAPEAVASRHRYVYLPFSAGPRICIGMTFALLEAVAVLAVLLPAFRLRAGPSAPSLKLRITLRPGDGLPMTAERRSSVGREQPQAASRTSRTISAS